MCKEANMSKLRVCWVCYIVALYLQQNEVMFGRPDIYAYDIGTRPYQVRQVR